MFVSNIFSNQNNYLMENWQAHQASGAAPVVDPNSRAGFV
jgi:hypothetical protein